LTSSKLYGRQIDIVGFVDELLLFALQSGEVGAQLVNDRLQLTIADESPIDLELDAASSKLRMMCARLGVLTKSDPYGGSGIILVDQTALLVSFQNTLSDVRLMIEKSNSA